MTADQPVAITGMGMVTAQGIGVRASWEGVLAGTDRLQTWDGIPAAHPLGKIKVAPCPALPRPGDLPQRLWRTLSRTQQLACVAADEALAQAGLMEHGRRLAPQRRARSGLFLATTVCGMDVNERFHEQYRVSPEHADVNLMRRIHPAEIASLLSRRRRIGAAGLRNVCLSTCVGSAMALGMAMDAINLGECDVALAGGSEALCRVVLSGFHSLKVVAGEGCRPFDQDRPGITVGEGAGMLVLEKISHAKQRGAEILGVLRGCGITCDGRHLTAPDPDAAQAIRAMRQAIERAGIEPDDIGYVNAHGTGTRDNDAMEARAIGALFETGRLAVSSTKRATGHTFGAAGAIEAILCVLAIRDGAAPVNAGALRPDAGLWRDRDPVVREQSVRKETAFALSTNFAFGGNNTALVFSSEAAHGG